MTGSAPVDVQDLPGGKARLSPDGARLMSAGPEHCVSELDGSGARCGDQAKAGTDWRFVAWSPDGERLAFTNNAWGYEEPDLWVFDVTTGDLRNLTDDGVDRIDVERPPARMRYDAFPTWSPDGESIWFARSHGPRAPTTLMSIPAAGGEATALREIPCAFDGLTALAWSATRVAWTCGLDVRLGEHTGARAELVLLATHDQDRRLLSFSPDGDWLLADSRYPQYSELWDGDPLAISVDDGDAVRVGRGEVGFPTWAPGDGHALAYVERPGTVWVTDEPGAGPRELYTAETVEGPDGLRLNWAPGSLLVIADGHPVLLTIAA